MHPQTLIDVIDKSKYTPQETHTLPLLRPFFMMKTQKGKPNVVKRIENLADAETHFGAETFNPTSKWWSREALYLKKLFENTGAFVMRLCDSSATNASWVLEAIVEQNATIPIYNTDSDGLRILNQDQGFDVSSTATGLRLFWRVRPLTGVETVDSLTTTSQIKYPDPDTGPRTFDVFPIMAFELDPGAFGNNIALSLNFNQVNSNSHTAQTNIESVMFDLTVSELDATTSKLTKMETAFGNKHITFSFNPQAIDKVTNVGYDFDTVVQQYKEFPFTYHIYTDHIKSLIEDAGYIRDTENTNATTDAVLDAFPLLPTTTPWLTNFISGTYSDSDYHYYQYIEVYTSELIDIYADVANGLTASDVDDTLISTLAGTGSIVELTDNVHTYCSGGDDGDLSQNNIEDLMATAFTNLTSVDTTEQSALGDYLKYPFNYIVDTGWKTNTKHAAITFMTERDDVFIDFAIQTLTVDITAYQPDDPIPEYPSINTSSVDYSAGQALMASIRANPESAIKGTGACRASVWPCVGVPIGYKAGTYVPGTYYALCKYAKYLSTQSIVDEPAGLPNSKADMFVPGSLSWLPSGETLRETFWSAGINYFEYCNMTEVHVPAIKTVYNDETSVLLQSMYTLGVIFAKQVARDVWVELVNVDHPFTIIKGMGETKLMARLSQIFGTNKTYSAEMYQTAEEAKIGYIAHVRLSITGNNVIRTHVVDIVCNREGLA